MTDNTTEQRMFAYAPGHIKVPESHPNQAYIRCELGKGRSLGVHMSDSDATASLNLWIERAHINMEADAAEMRALAATLLQSADALDAAQVKAA
jgi:hypothetical protein